MSKKRTVLSEEEIRIATKTFENINLKIALTGEFGMPPLNVQFLFRLKKLRNSFSDFWFF